MPIYRFDGSKIQGENTDYVITDDINSVSRIVKVGQTIELSIEQKDELDDNLYITLSVDPFPNAPVKLGEAFVVTQEAYDELTPKPRTLYVIVD